VKKYERERRWMVSIMGGKCKHCGNGDWRALQFDHVDAKPKGRNCHSGAKSNNRNSVDELRKRAREGTLSEVYQLLCANCHAIKTYESGDHKRKGSIVEEEDSLPLFDMLK